MKRTQKPLNLVVSTVQERSPQNRSHYRDIANFNYASPTHVPFPYEIPTIGSSDAEEKTPTLKRNNFIDLEKPSPSLSWGSYDKDDDKSSVYSQDSGCVIFELEPKESRCASADATPKTALTFAAIWDPERGFTTISGSQLLSNSGSSSLYGRDGDHGDDDDYGNGHPDCEPHLSSRFSVTTTSTSNYIDVDFGPNDRVGDVRNWTWPGGKASKTNLTTSDYLSPGDYHPPWIPQIFNVGYVRPKTPLSTPKRPEISEPFQLTGSRKQNPFLRGPSEFEQQLVRPPLPPIRRDSEDTIVSSETQASLPEWTPPKGGSSPSPTSLKRPRLPSVFGKLKRSATTSNIPPSPRVGDNVMKKGWVLVDKTGKMRAIQNA
ncbi:hypothetical protein PQX77_016236 [Marasmius sp. AFHP31]|nr:hypothetical protein PQX77_016236 [Marasmius sp. AFHP31]